ncbi:hypothetical protein H6G97_50410 [Nostoc flagelliforme FACHB-838]|uniref:Transposase n=1 Tax=Nostoc flagelliforme FACHB-838 TaxID=2692904 RepID=A0ABR8E5T1_9NOSO|nr:hypothetical protein [Nostoc flagelliforme]MBD2536986.1 hypothetical protein [Nostoc flagelliforme FACHB-838]
MAIWHPMSLGCSFNGDITTTGQRRSCMRSRAKLSATGVLCYASCRMSAVETLYILIQRSEVNAITLQLARNEQNQIGFQKMKNLDSWIAV